MASITRAFVALFATILVFTASAAEFKWTKPGGDPCNPKAGCTLPWALGKTEWPTEVKNVFTVAVTGEIPKLYAVERGWKGWMTWGKYSPKFQPNTVAVWPSGHTEPAKLWSTDYGGTRYNLVRVTKCGNWGGWTGAIPPKPEPKVEVEPVVRAPIPVDLMPLGSRVIAGCE